MVKGHKGLMFILYVVLGAYFLNVPFEFVEIPSALDALNQWFLFLGGIFLILGGINYLRIPSRLKHRAAH